MNEAKTRKELIDKYLHQAGWNINDQTQVITEFGINVGLFDYQRHQFSDYVLLGKNGRTTRQTNCFSKSERS